MTPPLPPHEGFRAAHATSAPHEGFRAAHATSAPHEGFRAAHATPSPRPRNRILCFAREPI